MRDADAAPTGDVGIRSDVARLEDDAGGAGDARADRPDAAREDSGAASTPAGPRALAPSFVQLELDQYPRPAAEACAGRATAAIVSPPATIQGALERAAPGSTVWIAPGTYVENPGEPTALLLDTDRVCLRATGAGAVVIQAAAGQGYGLTIRGDHIVVEGVTVRGFAASIGLEPRSVGSTQRGITLERIRVEAPTGRQRDGIVAYGDHRGLPGMPPAQDGLLLLDVSVEGVDLGVSCNGGPCHHWWIERVEVSGRAGSGSSGADTFAIEEGRQIAIVDSIFRNADGDGIDTKANDVVVMGAQVLAVGRNAIKLWRGGDVIDSVIDGSGADAALVGDRVGRYRYLHVLVMRHLPGGSSYVGTWAYDDPDPGLELEIVNSIFVQNAAGGFFVPSGATVSIQSSIFGDRASKLIDVGSTTYTTSELARFGGGNVLANPELVDPDARDWSTRSTSPARDRAEPVSGLVRDLHGGPRVRGVAADIGPVESR